MLAHRRLSHETGFGSFGHRIVPIDEDKAPIPLEIDHVNASDLGFLKNIAQTTGGLGDFSLV